MSSVIKDIEKLKAEHDDLCRELGTNDAEAEAVHKRRCKLLHEYNDMKDTATRLLTIYATFHAAPLKQVFEEFDVPDKDDIA